MHILYLHQHFVASSGTSGARSHEFSRILIERGHRVTLISGAYDHSGLTLSPGLITRRELDGIDLWLIRVPYSQSLSMASRMLAFVTFMVLACWVSLRIKGPDVVFATSTPLTIAVPGMLAARWNGCPFVFEVRDLWPQIPIDMGLLTNPVLIWLARRLEAAAYRDASEIVALSPGMKSGAEAGGASPDRVTVIPNASDVQLFRVPAAAGLAFRARHPEIGDRPLVVYAGAFGRANGLEYALDLAAAVGRIDPEARFLFIGKGSEKARLAERARASGVLGANVSFHDPVSRVELAEVLSAATLASSYFGRVQILEDNSANKFFDAFAAGKPIVLNYRGWQAEIIEREGAGLVLNPEDPAAAAAALSRALRDAAWLERAAAAARRLGDEVFNRRRLALELESVLLRAVARDAAQAPAAEGRPS